MTRSSDFYSEAWYLAHNPDVAEAVKLGFFTSGRQHFDIYGKHEGRSSGPLFDAETYLDHNPDVRMAQEGGGLSAYDHFLLYGVDEGRSPLRFFREDDYLRFNDDVRKAVENGSTTAIKHFLTFGMNEGRQINPFIDLDAYLDANPDVREAVENGETTALEHLLTFGADEGRELGNGVNLGHFSNDPAYREAIEAGRADVALDRMGKVAPFFPGFVSPKGWVPPVDIAIPLDFTPPDGIWLEIPENVKVPVGTKLPSWFKVPGPSVPDDTPPPQPSFTVSIDDDGLVTFGGKKTGPVSVELIDGKLQFTRDGSIAANQDIALADLAVEDAFPGDVKVALNGEPAEWLSLVEAVRLKNNFEDVKNYSVRGSLAELTADETDTVEAATCILLTDEAFEIDLGGMSVADVKKGVTGFTEEEASVFERAVNKDDIDVTIDYFVLDSMGNIWTEVLQNEDFLTGMKYELTDSPEAEFWAKSPINYRLINIVKGAENADVYKYQGLVQLFNPEDKVFFSQRPDFLEWANNDPMLRGLTLEGELTSGNYDLTGVEIPVHAKLGNMADTFKGGSGDDIIESGEGLDDLYGGGGADIFVVKNVSASSQNFWNTIHDFSIEEGDKIRIDDSSLAAKISAASTPNELMAHPVMGGPLDASSMHFYYDTGTSYTHIYFNVSGDANLSGADFRIVLAGQYTADEIQSDIFSLAIA